MNELQPNTTLQNGKYKIVRTLGQGSFGITYLAEFEIACELANAKMQFAVKEFFMKDTNTRSSDNTSVTGSQSELFVKYRDKFKKEAINLSKMSQYDDIVKVYDVFEENNTVYFTMEYIDGCNLDDYIKQHGKFSETDAIDGIRTIATALNRLHDNKMVHLDLKPKNIMRRNDGKLFLIDFGLSKQYDENGKAESSTTIGLGTPGYAPIEQANFKGIFAPTLDIYALGATFYKMLTGESAPDSTDIFEKGFTELRKEMQSCNVSEKTVNIVEKAMQPKKKDRYQSVGDFVKALPKGIDDDVIIDTHPLSPEDLNDLGKEHYKNKNYQEAFNYFSQAAKMDFPNAEYNLGVCYEKGKGVDQSFLYAAIYYKNAADKNFPNAKEKYEEIIKKHPEYKQSNIRTTFIIILMIGIAVLFGYVLLKLFGNFFSDNPKSATETIQAAPMQKPATESILAAEYQDVKVNETFQKLLGKWGAGKDNAGYSVEFCEGGKCKFIKKGQNIQFKSWRLKDEQTIEFEAETNSKSFFMPWQIINITANQLVVKNGETEISLNRLDSNYE